MLWIGSGLDLDWLRIGLQWAGPAWIGLGWVRLDLDWLGFGLASDWIGFGLASRWIGLGLDLSELDFD